MAHIYDEWNFAVMNQNDCLLHREMVQWCGGCGVEPSLKTGESFCLLWRSQLLRHITAWWRVTLKFVCLQPVRIYIVFGNSKGRFEAKYDRSRKIVWPLPKKERSCWCLWIFDISYICCASFFYYYFHVFVFWCIRYDVKLFWELRSWFPP